MRMEVLFNYDFALDARRGVVVSASLWWGRHTNNGLRIFCPRRGKPKLAQLGLCFAGEGV